MIVVVLLSSVLWAQTGGHSADDLRSDVERELPIPSGEYGIGRRALDLTDNPHPDSRSSISANHRELMVYIWYPAQQSSSKSYSEYFPFAAEIDKDPKYKEAAREIFGASWPMIVDGSVHAHAITDAPPVVGEKFPVVLFFPGYSSTTFSYTAQIENLVSYGYVVVAIEDTNGSGMVRFSDGRIGLLQSTPPSGSRSTDPLQTMIASAQQGTQTGAEQAGYVLNALKKITPLSKVMNLSRVAVAGHSAGGTLAARACQIDPRIKVCISEDGEVNPVGAFFDYPVHHSMQQPFLFIQVEHNPTDEELSRMHESRTKWNDFLVHEQWQLRQCGQGSYFIQLHRSGMGHSGFSDGPVLNARDNEQAAIALGNLRTTEELEKAFLDKYLKGESTSIFDRTDATPQGMTIEPIDK
jgi:predicted dienelactone hydrolase